MGCNCLSKDDNLPEEIKRKTATHPCYSAEAHQYARMHLPVAPKCNISCNYCNRKYDCLNESRPGVTSEILTPEAALAKYLVVKEKVENLKVIGIAGPGDGLANWDETKKSIELIKAAEPDVTVCLSTNGLMLPEYADEILALGVNHITVTLNTIRADVGAKIYAFVNYKGKIFQGIEGAEILLKNQLAGIKYMADKGVLVKINIVMIKGINDEFIEETVKTAKELGAFMTNIMPLIPAGGSNFENMPLISNIELNAMRNKCLIHMKQMYHCQQCRADAIGKLKEDRSIEFRNNESDTGAEIKNTAIRVAVATSTGDLIDKHFGHVEEFYIYDYIGEEVEFVERRAIEKYCTGAECDDGDSKIDKLIKSISDCKMVLSLRIGHEPKKKLINNKIIPVETYDMVKNGIKEAAKNAG